ncbi:MAG: VCBS repeat-containing protein [Acidobacteria bacterium]|nr:VCBS repeat-containing protein [Acidobacteriota bacterium]
MNRAVKCTLVAALALGAGGAMLMTSACARQSAHVSADREAAYRSNNLGVARLEQFRYDAAAAAFREALHLDPALDLARVNLSIALFYLPDLAGATTEATAAARRLPEAPQPPYILGLIARAENRDADAERFFARVRQIDPRDSGAAINLGQIYLQDRKYAEAIAVLRSAVAEEPFSVTAAYNLGLALARAGQRDEGQQMMERSQTLRTTGYGTTLSNSYLEQGRYAEAAASTGAEADLVDPATPPATFTASPLVSRAGAASPPPASPFGRSFTATDLTAEGARRIALALGGGLTLFDVDGDGDLDLFVAAPAGERLFRNDGGVFTDITAGSGLGVVPPGAVAIGCVAGDIDNDGKPDLFVLRYGASSLYHNDGNGRFTDITARSGLPAYAALPGAAALVDVDHDGDLDLVIAGLADVAATHAAAGQSVAFPRDFAPAPLRLLRNNGDGTFTDTTREAGLAVQAHAVAIVPTDFDNHRDVDLLIVNRDRAPLLFKNRRDGTFRDVASDVGLTGVLPGDGDITSVAAADLNKDDYPDFFFARSNAAGVIAMSDGRGRYTIAAAADGTRGTAAALFFDYDNDGLLDLGAWTPDGLRVFRNLGQRWSDVTSSALPSRSATAGAGLASARALAIGDLEGNGHSDVVAAGADRVSNRSAAGTKVQTRSGSLTQRLATSATTPVVAPADLVFGLGRRPGADVVRVLWPSGILQAEYAGSADAAAPPATTPTPLPSALTVEELDRKPSSCPFLYTWNGERFEFVTDFMGGGEMGDWEGPGTYDAPDPVEYVRIRGDQLKPRNGRYEIRVTNELEETLFVDRLQLIAVAHPAGVEVFPNEGMTDPPKPVRLYTVKDERPVARATDEHGHDVTARLARVDRQYPDDFELKNIRGYAGRHELTIDTGTGQSPLLLLTAWTDYAFSSDNVAAHQAGLVMTPPSLSVKGVNGQWREAIADIGIPVGRPQTMVVDLAPVLRPGEHEVRIVTNMRIYWDQILVASVAPGVGGRATRLDPLTAHLHTRGFSIDLRPDGREPETYDYSRVTARSPWKTMTGRFTREGDVRPLLVRSDDMFVISKPGDEIALSFDATGVGVLPPGWTRTFLLMADGFSKEMDINSASPDRVEPLPFHRMTKYPYAAPEHYPTTPAHEQYRARYNTRVVVKNPEPCTEP